MKIIIILLLLGLSVNYTSSQKRVSLNRSPEKFYLGVNAGPSFSEGDFGNKDVTPNSGYATTGYRLELYGGVNILSMFGISAMGFMNINGTDPENLKNKLNSDYPGSNWQIDSKNWKLYGGMGGVSFLYPVSNRTTVNISLMAGYLSAESPEFRFTSGASEYKIESSTANSWSYLTKVGIYQYLGQNISVTLDFEFLGSRPQFDIVKTSANISGNLSESTTSFTRQISAFNIGLGFRYGFK